MNFKVDVLFPGFSGKLAVGYMGFSTWAYVEGAGHKIMLDTGFVGLRQDYERMLALHGVRREEIDYVLLTHLHFDHAVNVDMFPNATFVCSRAEWEYANNEILRDKFVELPALAVLNNSRLVLVEDGDEVLPGITAILTPGHTPGCCSYLLDQGDGTVWGLVGDAAKNRRELERGEVQMSLDPESSAASLKRIRESCDRVLPGHDGWLTIKDGKVIAEGGNDIHMVFGQGVTVNGGQTEIVLKMDE